MLHSISAYNAFAFARPPHMSDRDGTRPAVHFIATYIYRGDMICSLCVNVPAAPENCQAPVGTTHSIA
jgi:hypothetical protein